MIISRPVSKKKKKENGQVLVGSEWRAAAPGLKPLRLPRAHTQGSLVLKMREGDRRGEERGEREEGREIPRDTKTNLCVDRFYSTGKHLIREFINTGPRIWLTPGPLRQVHH